MKTITFNTDRKQLSFTKLSGIELELRWRDVRGSYILSMNEAEQLRDYLNSVLECGHEKEIDAMNIAIWNEAIEEAAKVANNWSLYCEYEIRKLKK